jgi:photosystem II stability/assembly factor-like uncharacterized protein
MYFLHLTILYSMLIGYSADTALESSPTSPANILKSTTAKVTTTDDVIPEATNLILQSKDGGQTWDDISQGMPEKEQPTGFFAGPSDIYLRVKNVMYHSKSNFKAPVWKKEHTLDPGSTSITFNPSGIKAYNLEGQIYQKTHAKETWSPVHRDFRKRVTGTWLKANTNFEQPWLRTIIETSDGSIFLGCDDGLYKSANQGQSWKHVLKGGWVMDIVESDGVLIGTSQSGIIRSTDNGEHWETVISEGGVGIAVERIDGGFAAISFNTKSQSRRIRISLDGGKTWKAIDEGLQPNLFLSSVKIYKSSSSFTPVNGLQAKAFISSIKQMGKYLICGHPDGILRSPDMGATWNLVHAGVDEKVFKIYASGDILYAVLGFTGC